MPVLKPIQSADTPTQLVVEPAPVPLQTPEDAERRKAEAIAFVQSDTFRNETRRQDAEMAGDLGLLIKKPFFMRTVIGVLVLVCVGVFRGYLRSERINRYSSRLAAEEATPAPAYPTMPQSVAPVGISVPQQRHYVAPPAPIYNPDFDLRRRSDYVPPQNMPGLPQTPGIPGMPTPDRTGRTWSSGRYPQYGGRSGPTEHDRMVEEILRQQEERQQQQQQSQSQQQQEFPQPPDAQGQPPPAFPQAPQNPPPSFPQDPSYPQQPTAPPEQVPSNPPAGNEGGAYLPPPRF